LSEFVDGVDMPLLLETIWCEVDQLPSGSSPRSMVGVRAYGAISAD
jgi:hypothetical protein